MGSVKNVELKLPAVGKKLKKIENYILTEQERLFIFGISFDELSL